MLKSVLGISSLWDISVEMLVDYMALELKRETWLGDHQWNYHLHTIFHSFDPYLINLPCIKSNEIRHDLFVHGAYRQGNLKLKNLYKITWKLLNRCRYQLGYRSRAQGCNWIVNSYEKFFIVYLKWMTTCADIEDDEKKRHSGYFSARKISEIIFSFIFCLFLFCCPFPLSLKTSCSL